MAFDITKPVTTDNYLTAFCPSIIANETALAQMLDSVQTTITGTPPTYSKRYNRASAYLEEFSGSVWAQLSFTASNVPFSGITSKPTTLAGYGITDVNSFAPTLTGGGASGAAWAIGITGNSATATKSTNVAGGVAGAVHYQSAVDTTGFSAAGTAGQMLVSGGAGAPTWSNALPAAATIGGQAVGYLNIPQLAQAPATALTLAGAGCHFYATGAAGTWTIPANASVAFPIGTALTFVNPFAGACSIAITTDTMTLAGTTTVGTRTLAQNGMATALKVTATSWIISGSGLT